LYRSVDIVSSLPEDGINQVLCYPAHSDSVMKTELTASFSHEVSRIISLKNITRVFAFSARFKVLTTVVMKI